MPLTASSSTATEQQPQRERVRVVHHMQVGVTFSLVRFCVSTADSASAAHKDKQCASKQVTQPTLLV